MTQVGARAGSRVWIGPAVLLVAGLALTACSTSRPNLAGLLAERVWSEEPPGAEEVWFSEGREQCDWMGDAMEVARTVAVVDASSAEVFYRELASATGWTVTPREGRFGFYASKPGEGGSTMHLALRDTSMSAEGDEVELRGSVDPDGC